MDWQKIGYLIPYFVSLMISSSLGIYALYRREVSGAIAYALFALGQAIATLGYTFELLSSSLESKIFWDNVQWIPTVYGPIFFLTFAIQYTGRKLAHPRLILGALGVIPTIFTLMVVTNDLHRLVLSEAWLIHGEPFSALVYNFTPMIWAMGAYIFGLMLWSIAILLSKYLRAHRLYRAQTGTILIGALIPLVGAAFTLAGITFTFHRDLTPFTFAIGNLVVAWGLFNYRLFDVVPLARETIIENMRDALVVLDTRNRLVDANLVALRYLNRPSSEVIGKPIDSVFVHLTDLINQYRNVEEVHTEILLDSPQGKSYYELSISPLLDRRDRLAGRLILAHDITERKRAEEELRQHHDLLETLVAERTADLRTANKQIKLYAEELEQRVAERTAELEAKNRELETFAYSISHDLKAPLRGIDGYSRLLLDGYTGTLDEEGRTFLYNIRNATEQMNQLINDLLDYSRLQRKPLVKGQVNLPTILETVLTEREGELYYRAVDTSVEIPFQYVTAEAEGLTQALRNLLDNALKFTREVPKPQIKIGGSETEDAFILWVRDNGVGFDIQYHDRMFEIFQRLHRSEDYPGTGVGLALVRTAMQRIGGKVWAESAPGAGATFYLEIPKQELEG